MTPNKVSTEAIQIRRKFWSMPISRDFSMILQVQHGPLPDEDSVAVMTTGNLMTMKMRNSKKISVNFDIYNQ